MTVTDSGSHDRLASTRPTERPTERATDKRSDDRTRRARRPPPKRLPAPALTIAFGLTMALGLAFGPSVACAQTAVPDPLNRAGPYDYSVIDADLRRVLTDLGGNLGIAVNVDPAITGRAVGPLPTASARAFLDRLAAVNNLAYFYDGQVLHVTPASANESRLVALDEVSFETLRDTLASLGVLDERFALRPSGDGTVSLVAGPPRYVALVEATLAALTAARSDRGDDRGDDGRDEGPEQARLPEQAQPPERSQPPTRTAPPAAPRRQPLVVFRGGATQVLPDGRPSE